MSASWDCSIKRWEYNNQLIDEDSVEIIYEHESQISCMDFSLDERIIGFGDIDGKGVLLLHEEYEVVL